MSIKRAFPEGMPGNGLTLTLLLGDVVCLHTTDGPINVVFSAKKSGSGIRLTFICPKEIKIQRMKNEIVE